MKKAVVTFLVVGGMGAAGFALWSRFLSPLSTPQVRVSPPIAQALPHPRSEQVTQHLLNPRLAELTGYLEVLKATSLDQNKQEGAIYFYTVHTVAGPIRFQPVLVAEERVHQLHGALVHLRESEEGYSLLDRADSRRFVFELLRDPDPVPGASVDSKLVMVTPNMNGVKTLQLLRLARESKLSFDRTLIGPDCLAPTGTQIFALMDQSLLSLELSEGVTFIDYFVVAKEGCLKAQYSSLGPMRYRTPQGDRWIQVRFQVWDGQRRPSRLEAEVQTPNESAASVEPQAGSPLVISKLEDGAGCGELRASAKLSPSLANQEIVFRAHQVGLADEHSCRTTTDLMGTATCTISGLDPSIPYMISAQKNESFDMRFWSTSVCVDPNQKKLSFVKKARSADVRAGCDPIMPVTLRTEGLTSGAQVIVLAEDELGQQQTCLATVQDYDGVGLAKCTLSNMVDEASYTLLAMYEGARAWAFLQMPKRPKNCQ